MADIKKSGQTVKEKQTADIKKERGYMPPRQL
jgi:hypothetical protein